MSKILLEPAYVLHSRPYRETSLLVDVLTQKHGRICVVARGAKKKPSNVIQPFIKSLVSWQGKSELQTLTAIENISPSFILTGKCLFCGLYVNELMTLVLHRNDSSVSHVFDLYEKVICDLDEISQKQEYIEKALRIFEINLLTELGYGIYFGHDVNTSELIDQNQFYQFIPGKGFICAKSNDSSFVFLGKIIQAISDNDFSLPETLQSAKRLTRLAFSHVLGNKSLKSRDLF